MYGGVLVLGGALIFSRGSKSERHLRKKINPAVTRPAVTDPANSRHLKKSLEARHLPGEVTMAAGEKLRLLRPPFSTPLRSLGEPDPDTPFLVPIEHAPPLFVRIREDKISLKISPAPLESGTSKILATSTPTKIDREHPHLPHCKPELHTVDQLS